MRLICGAPSVHHLCHDVGIEHHHHRGLTPLHGDVRAHMFDGGGPVVMGR